MVDSGAERIDDRDEGVSLVAVRHAPAAPEGTARLGAEP